MIGLGMAALFVLALLSGLSSENFGATIGFFFLMLAAQIVALISNVIILRKGTVGWKIVAGIYSIAIVVFFGAIIYALYDLAHTTYN